MVRVTGKRLFGWASAILTVISFSRVLVLFLEAMATVRDERSQDYELLDICQRGEARGAPVRPWSCRESAVRCDTRPW